MKTQIIKKKYIVKLNSLKDNEIKHIVEAIDMDNAIKKVCKLEGIEYNPKCQPNCSVQRSDE